MQLEWKVVTECNLCHKSYIYLVTFILIKPETDYLQSKEIKGEKRLCNCEVTIPRSMVSQRSHSQKAHLGDINPCEVGNWLAAHWNFCPEKNGERIYNWGWWHQGQRSIKGLKPPKAHQLDMTLIPAKYEIDLLHNLGTTGWKKRQDIEMQVQMDGQMDSSHWIHCLLGGRHKNIFNKNVHFKLYQILAMILGWKTSGFNEIISPINNKTFTLLKDTLKPVINMVSCNTNSDKTW